MEIEERTLENVVVLDLKGKLTIGEGDELLKEKINNVLQQGHKNRADDSSLAETAELLYGTALLAEGGALDDPARFAGLLADRLAQTV